MAVTAGGLAGPGQTAGAGRGKAPGSRWACASVLPGACSRSHRLPPVRRVPCGCPAISSGAPAPKGQLPGVVTYVTISSADSRGPSLRPPLRATFKQEPVPFVAPPLRVALRPVRVPSEPPPLRETTPPARALPFRPPLRATFPSERPCPFELPLRDPLPSAPAPVFRRFLAVGLPSGARRLRPWRCTLFIRTSAASTGLEQIRKLSTANPHLSTGRADYPPLVPSLVHKGGLDGA